MSITGGLAAGILCAVAPSHEFRLDSVGIVSCIGAEIGGAIGGGVFVCRAVGGIAIGLGVAIVVASLIITGKLLARM